MEIGVDNDFALSVYSRYFIGAQALILMQNNGIISTVIKQR